MTLKTLPLVLCCAGLSIAAGVVTELLARPPAPVAAAPVADRSTAALRARLDALAEAHEELARQLAELRERPVAPARRVAADDIEAAVARWMTAQAGQAGAAESREPDSDRDRAAALLARMSEPDFGGDDLEGLWIELRQAGLADEALALLEERAAASPHDLDLQVALGMAYIYQLDEVGSGPQAGRIASRADEAFDRALALDDRHWGARFAKATALSFWPSFLGKQAEAIENFEVLIAQQEEGAASPEHADTYLFLGNLYKQAGRFDEAKATWEAGFALFPDRADLGQQLAAAD